MIAMRIFLVVCVTILLAEICQVVYWVMHNNAIGIAGMTVAATLQGITIAILWNIYRDMQHSRRN